MWLTDCVEKWLQCGIFTLCWFGTFRNVSLLTYHCQCTATYYSLSSVISCSMQYRMPRRTVWYLNDIFMARPSTLTMTTLLLSSSYNCLAWLSICAQAVFWEILPEHLLMSAERYQHVKSPSSGSRQKYGTFLTKARHSHPVNLVAYVLSTPTHVSTGRWGAKVWQQWSWEVCPEDETSHLGARWHSACQVKRPKVSFADR